MLLKILFKKNLKNPKLKEITNNPYLCLDYWSSISRVSMPSMNSSFICLVVVFRIKIKIFFMLLYSNCNFSIIIPLKCMHCVGLLAFTFFKKEEKKLNV